MQGLDAAQRDVVTRLIGPWRQVGDLSWDEQSTHVLQVCSGAGDFVVKAGNAGNHHIAREITAHSRWTSSLVHLDRTAPAVGWDEAARVLVLRYQPGTLVEGTPQEHTASFHRQAGIALKALHCETQRVDTDYERRASARALAWLDGRHRIEPAVEKLARDVLAAHDPGPVTVVPTHGDWQPRNWLADGAWLRVIDFGRFDFRPASSDLCRLATQQWADRPDLEEAFLDGYGCDPRDARWQVELLREAIGTATWAYLRGDEEFEAHGHRCLTAALEALA